MNKLLFTSLVVAAGAYLFRNTPAVKTAISDVSDKINDVVKAGQEALHETAASASRPLNSASSNKNTPSTHETSKAYR